MIGLQCRLATRLECSVCKQPIDDEEVHEGEVMGILFGHRKYALCCCCHQQVDPSTARNRGYRDRWDRWYGKLASRAQAK